MQTDLVRPWWDYSHYHRQEWIKRSVTGIMCERDTLDILKISVETLLRFYPDMPLLIIDGGSTDGSVEYIKLKALQYPNISVWQREGRNGHGTMLDEGIRSFISTKYVLLLDSDINVHRGAWLEQMIEKMNAERNLYAIGTLMLVSNAGDACGAPLSESDILRYAHPSCSLIRRDQYLKLRPFVEHGAPCVYNMQDAQTRSLDVAYFPIEKYVSHLSGASWTDPKTIWKTDRDAFIRPFFTFLIDDDSDVRGLVFQEDKDFDIVCEGKMTHARVVIHNVAQYDVNNKLYTLRHRVTGEYVCRLLDREIPSIFFTTLAKLEILQNRLPESFDYADFKFQRRDIWQQKGALL